MGSEEFNKLTGFHIHKRCKKKNMCPRVGSAVQGNRRKIHANTLLSVSCLVKVQMLTETGEEYPSECTIYRRVVVVFSLQMQWQAEHAELVGRVHALGNPLAWSA